MSSYSDLKVTELREELKKRGIPTTGLTRKQQIIDRLVDEDNEKGQSEENVEDAPASPSAVADAPIDQMQVDQVAPQDTTDDVTEEQDASIEQAKSEAIADAALQGVPVQLVDAASVQAQDEPDQPVEVAAAQPVEEQQVQEEPATIQSEQQQIQEESAPAQSQQQDARPDVAIATPTQPSDEQFATTSLDQAADGNLDSRKRKRRSLTPSISEESVNKKLKQVEEAHGAIPQLQDDVDLTAAPPVSDVAPREDTELEMPDVPIDKPDATVLPMSTSDDVMDLSKPDAIEPTTETITESAPQDDSELLPSKTARSPNQRRFKDIINPSAAQDSANLPASRNDKVEIAPALHPATRALYVRELIRPINKAALKEHLEQLATPPGQSASGHAVEECYVDSLKTHAFVMFDSITAASRARASLHTRTWPSEAQRKPLWVDFIPEERMSAWIDQERAGGSGSRASTAKRWEVAYEDLDDRVNVTLVEASAAGGQQRPSFAQGMPGAPSGPRGSMSGPQRSSFSQSERRRPSQPVPPVRPTAKAVEEASASFLELDKLFRFTTAKPKLYWQPVSDGLADKRLDELDRETSRDWNPREDAKINGDTMGRGLDQLKRYTFEDGDMLVDGGPEYGGGAAFGRSGDNYRGGGGGGGRRRGADRYRS